MNRRNFLQRGLTATAVTTVAGNAFASDEQVISAFTKSTSQQPTFKLNYAPHDGMFSNHAGKDFVEQIKFMHEQGFRGIEDNGMLKRSKEEQDKIGATLAKLGMTMGVFVVDGGAFVSQADKNPTWTILALSLRASNYIVDELKKQNL